MRKRIRNRIFVSLISSLAFLFIFILSIQNPPQKQARASYALQGS